MQAISLHQIAQIELLLLDVDGVLTDGRVTYLDDGREVKSFHVRDGSAIKFWRQSGKSVAIVSGRRSPAVDRRAQELGISHVIQGVGEKLPAFERILKETGLSAAQVCAIGDDLPDLPVLAKAGVAVAVADAVAEVRAIANYVTATPGGCGAVREAIEWLMRNQGSWDKAVAGLQLKAFPSG